MNKKAVRQPQIIALKDLRLNTQSYITKVANGESFVVVKRSRPAFRIEPIVEQWETVADFTSISSDGIPANDIIAAIDVLRRKPGNDRQNNKVPI